MPNTTMRNIFFSFVYFVKDFHVLMPAYTALVYQHLASIGISSGTNLTFDALWRAPNSRKPSDLGGIIPRHSHHRL
jgi:hypothetical protein